MVRGLAQHITETDISDDIHNCGLVAKDIRLIRKKETGTQKKRLIFRNWHCFPLKKKMQNSGKFFGKPMLQLLDPNSRGKI